MVTTSSRLNSQENEILAGSDLKVESIDILGSQPRFLPRDFKA